MGGTYLYDTLYKDVEYNCDIAVEVDCIFLRLYKALL